MTQVPPIVWQDSFGGTNDEVAYRMQITADGGYMIVGLTWSTDGDVADVLFERQALLMKYDSTGVLQWQKTYGGSTTDHSFFAEQTGDGGFVLAMESQSSDGTVPENHGHQDFVFYLLDSAGNIEYTDVIGGTLHDHPSCIRQCPDGSFVMAGGSLSNDIDVSGHHGSQEYMDIWVVKLNSDGVIKWSKSFGGSYTDFGRYVLPMDNGNLMVVGESNSNDGDISGHHGTESSSDAVVLMLDSSGNIIWQKSYGGGADETGHFLISLDGGCFAMAASAKSIDGDVSLNHGSFDYWLVKIDSTGEILWEKTYGGSQKDYCRQVSESIQGGFIMSGEASSIDGDVTESFGDADFWIVRTDAEGNLVFQSSYGGGKEDIGSAMVQRANGNYVFASTCYSNDGQVEEHYGNTNYSDIWIAEADNDESVPTNSSFPESQNSGLTLELHPNPAASHAHVSITNSSNEPDIRLSVYSTDMRLLIEEHAGMVSGRQVHFALDFSSLPAGAYLLLAKSARETAQQLFVISR